MQFVNGMFVMEHSVGHLPFEAEIGPYLTTNGAQRYTNRITVALNNTLNSTTVPPSAFNYASSNDYYM